jgi:hypothetical protein
MEVSTDNHLGHHVRPYNGYCPKEEIPSASRNVHENLFSPKSPIVVYMAVTAKRKRLTQKEVDELALKIGEQVIKESKPLLDRLAKV